MPAGPGHGGPGGVYVVKIGGSVATRKDEPFSIRLPVLRSIARQLRAAVDAGVRVGVVLGGGSYGHVVAHAYRGSEAPASEALSAVTASMLELALAVSDVLAGEGLRPVVYPPHAFCSPRGLRPGCSWRQVVEALELGAVPLVYGDAYPCGGDWCIVSGDELAVEMACSVGAEYVVYLSDVDGVIGSDGSVIPVLRLSDAALEAAPVERRGYDVTGGMLRKIEAVRENRCPGLRGVWVLNGLARDDRLLRLLRGERVVSTLIIP